MGSRYPCPFGRESAVPKSGGRIASLRASARSSEETTGRLLTRVRFAESASEVHPYSTATPPRKTVQLADNNDNDLPSQPVRRA
ncbi:hypothetical protein N7539_004406 [Penicillium diatomitis]|uniref:Uncharacterized protein n=1 Tax=Penicillium diatomitis TaxID=2819901 RepID=A0A9W9XDV1_9EURO|nr:uncharacterized protein N7539_004406 [Penicillium diatomitis]KAJ5489516.1 hypothetical protein N7539_004406 [Penicillium diatomitis]